MAMRTEAEVLALLTALLREGTGLGAVARALHAPQADPVLAAALAPRREALRDVLWGPRAGAPLTLISRPLASTWPCR